MVSVARSSIVPYSNWPTTAIAAIAQDDPPMGAKPQPGGFLGRNTARLSQQLVHVLERSPMRIAKTWDVIFQPSEDIQTSLAGSERRDEIPFPSRPLVSLANSYEPIAFLAPARPARSTQRTQIKRRRVPIATANVRKTAHIPLPMIFASI